MPLKSGALFQWGPIQFMVFPLNFHELDQMTSTDWARKEIAGAAVYREWTGEGDEELHMRGRLFPYFFGPHTTDGKGGLNELGLLEECRRSGSAQMMVRGDGCILGWYVMERLVRSHTFPSGEGIGKVINFEAMFARVPTPSSDDYFPVLWKLSTTGAA